MKNIITYLCFTLLIASPSFAQKSTTTGSNAIEPPTVTFLFDMPAPKVEVAGQPKIVKLPPNQGKGKGFFTTYDTDDGVAMDAISIGKTSLCDRDGNLWFGTYGGGVCKYNGKTFTTFSTDQGLASNSVMSILEDKKGNFWFTTYGGGVSMYDGETFTNYNTDQGLASNYVYCVLEDKKGNFWFGTADAGVSMFNGKTFTTYNTDKGLANNTVMSILEDKKGNLWFCTVGGGVSKYNEGKFTTYNSLNGLANNRIMSILEDKKGNLWFGTDGRGVSKYNGKTFTSYSTDQGLPNKTVMSILEDKKGNLWFGTYGGGVCKYNGETFTTYNTDQGLANNSVMSMLEDKTGNLWFGTYGGGISKYNRETFITNSTSHGLSNNLVYSIIEDIEGNLWFGTYGGGVCKYNGESFSTYGTDQGLANNIIYSILEDKEGNLWFGSNDKGVIKYNGETFTTYGTDQGLANNTVFSILEDKEGNLWFGTYGGGVSKFNGEYFTTYTTQQGLANNIVRSIIEDKKGNLWFGTDGGGVSKFNGKRFTTYSTDQGLTNNIVFSILEDKKGNLWFGTYGGGVSLLMHNSDKKDSLHFITITTSDGLPDNAVGGIIEDKHGNIIIGAIGLGIIPFGDLEKEIEVYNQFNGYPVRDINGGSNNGALFCDSKGIIWVGTGSDKTALVRFDYSEINKNIKSPKVVIQQVKVNGENVSWYNISLSPKGEKSSSKDSTLLVQQEMITYGKVLSNVERDSIYQKFKGIEFDAINKFYPLPQNLVLSYKHNALTFSFNAIETDRNFLVNYQYMLEGLDETWSPVTKKTDATYNNLSEGDYIFLLKAQSPWGVWSVPVKYSFTVLPPWYRTWWAYILYAVLFVFVIRLIVKMQTQRLKAKQKELEQEVDNATIEIRRQKEKIEESHKEITDSINYAKRIQSAILPQPELVKQYLPDSFILYKPKDIVAGDFYWMEPVKNKVLFAAADCTGHGVPGAMVSVVCNNGLNRSVRESGLSEPGKILDKTREIVTQEFEKSADDVKDGMDIALCSLELNSPFEGGERGMTLKYAGANNPLWIIRPIRHSGLDPESPQNKATANQSEIAGQARNNGFEILETKANKQPIGQFDNPEPYTTHTFELQKGDVIYIFSDGFVDQFGGPKDKKFKAKAFKELLLGIQNENMENQKVLIEKAFDNWKDDLEQIDDVCVIGVRI